jgi:hypothetical protein
VGIEQQALNKRAIKKEKKLRKSHKSILKEVHSTKMLLKKLKSEN